MTDTFIPNSIDTLKATVNYFKWHFSLWRQDYIGLNKNDAEIDDLQFWSQLTTILLGDQKAVTATDWLSREVGHWAAIDLQTQEVWTPLSLLPYPLWRIQHASSMPFMSSTAVTGLEFLKIIQSRPIFHAFN